MFGISFAELAIIALLILVVLGPEKLPEVAKWAGKGMRELRQASNTLRDALLIDDLDGTRNRQAPRVEHSNSSPRPSSPQNPTPPAPKFPTAQPSRPGGLDQLDEASFDRMLEKQYRVHHNQLIAVPLAAPSPTDDLDAIELAAPDWTEAINDTVTVELAPSRPPELS